MLKKEKLIGMTVVRSLSPLDSIRDFFGMKEREAPPIIMGSPEYRKYREAIKSKKETWVAVSTGIEKQQNADLRFKLRNKRGMR